MDCEKLNIRTIPDLVKLPWFESGPSGVRLRPDSGLPSVIDMHTHLGFSYGFSPRLDLTAKTPEVEYFINYNKPSDVLGALNNSLKDDKETELDMYLIMVRQPPRAKTHTLPNLLEEMDRFGISRAMSLPIEIPFWPRHGRHTLETCRGQDRVIPFAAVHPWDPDPRRRLKWYLKHGCPGLKYHPEFQFHPPDSTHALRLFGHCEELGVVVLSHSGSTGSEPVWMRRMSALPRFRPVFERFPKLRFILAHCGLFSVDEAIAYSREFPNVYIETSSQPVPVLKKIFREADNDRVLFGSDWPFFPVSVPLACALVATDGNPELREKYLHLNAARLLRLKS